MRCGFIYPVVRGPWRNFRCVEGAKLCVPLTVIVLFGVAGGRWYGMQRKRGQYDYCMCFGGLVLCHYLCCTTVIIAEHIRSLASYPGPYERAWVRG